MPDTTELLLLVSMSRLGIAIIFKKPGELDIAGNQNQIEYYTLYRVTER